MQREMGGLTLILATQDPTIHLRVLITSLIDWSS